MKRTMVLLPTLVLGLGLALTGCGGGDDSDPEPTDASTSAAPAITQDEFTEQANAVCAAGNAEIQTAAGALGEDPAQEEIEAFASDILVGNLQGQHDDIEALGAPEGSEADVTAMLDALQAAVDDIGSDPSLITTDANPFEEANTLASELGLTECTG